MIRLHLFAIQFVVAQRREGRIMRARLWLVFAIDVAALEEINVRLIGIGVVIGTNHIDKGRFAVRAKLIGHFLPKVRQFLEGAPNRTLWRRFDLCLDLGYGLLACA